MEKSKKVFCFKFCVKNIQNFKIKLFLTKRKYLIFILPGTYGNIKTFLSYKKKGVIEIQEWWVKINS